ncbi:MAG: tetratricopeptide repeat protein [Pirellulales bacterium]
MSQRPGISERPGIGDRPGIDRPGPSDRPGGRPGIGDRPGVDRPRPADRPGDRPGDGYRPDRPDWANNRPGDWGYNHIDHDYWHHGNWHDHWDHGWYNRPAGWWWGGFATGVAASAIPWNWGYYSYYNPYAVQPIVVGSTTVDYSQPLVTSSESYAAAPPPSDAPPSDAPAEPTPAELAAKSFDAARESFTAGDYKTALSQVEEAISRLPDDATLHEFRALVLFATGRYKEAAAAIYAVLSAGPGWDWTTLGGLYSSIDTYTKQLRGLEAYCRQNPNEADARFLLGYHYLTLGETSAAAAEFKQVVKLNPKDTLAAQLLASLEPPPGQPAPTPQQPAPAAEPPAPQKPVTAASLAGRWKATQPDGTSVALDLGKDAKYTWRVSKDGKQHDFGGSYTVADNLLILNQNNSPAMVGQVAQLAAASFNFRLPGAPPSDPGLTFSR